MPIPDALVATCPSRGLIARLGEKWAMLVIIILSSSPVRFGELLRRIKGVSQKMLTQTLRSLERDGLVDRLVISTRPLAVQYRLTPLGESLAPIAISTKQWAEQNLFEIEAANLLYDTELAQD
jgi:DNA-binding HxlR family transcriptional regulator